MASLGRGNRRLAAVLVVVALALAGASLRGVYLLARSKTTQVVGRIVPRVETSERAGALTFDDGPTKEHLDEILDVLASKGVRATFFLIGSSVGEAPEAARRLVAAGHELGNHTYGHPHMWFQSPRVIREEVVTVGELMATAG